MKSGASLMTTCFIFIFSISLLNFVFGADNKNVTQENYDKIKIGMTIDRVTKILGEPVTVEEAALANAEKAEFWHYQSGNNSIDVTFQKGKVTGKDSDFYSK